MPVPTGLVERDTFVLDSTPLVLESQCQTSWPPKYRSWKAGLVLLKKTHEEKGKHSIATTVLWVCAWQAPWSTGSGNRCWKDQNRVYRELSPHTVASVILSFPPHGVKYCLDYNIELGLTWPTLLLEEWKIAQPSIVFVFGAWGWWVMMHRDCCAA